MPRNELMETADITVLGFFLIQKREFGFIKFFEELVPADFLQSLLLRPEIDAQNAGFSVFLGVLDRRRRAAPLLRPGSDFLVVRGGVAFAHVRLLDPECASFTAAT